MHHQVWGVGFRVQGLGLRLRALLAMWNVFQALGLTIASDVLHLRPRVANHVPNTTYQTVEGGGGLGFGGLGFRVWGLGLGFRARVWAREAEAHSLRPAVRPPSSALYTQV